MTDMDDDFEVIDSQYELIQSVREEDRANQGAPDPEFEVRITPTKNEVDLTFVENQFYQFEVLRGGSQFCRVERRFSEFELMFEILSRKEPGFIFPAFPANGLFAFMKSKVSLSKDEEFVRRRTKLIARFFTLLLNRRQFQPQACSQIKVFLSGGKQFEARKQIERGTKGGLLSSGWTKIKGIFAYGKDNEFTEVESRLAALREVFARLYSHCRSLLDLLKEEHVLNTIFFSQSFAAQKLGAYIDLVGLHEEKQASTLSRLQELQFLIFCENEDLQMVPRVLTRIAELRENEDHYIELQRVRSTFKDNTESFFDGKQKAYQKQQQQLRQLAAEVKATGRVS